MTHAIPTIQWICRSCDAVFDGKDKRDYHHRKEHQNRNLNSITRDNSEQIARNEARRMFQCECGKTYVVASSLKRHKTICNAENSMEQSAEHEEHVIEGTTPICEQKIREGIEMR